MKDCISEKDLADLLNRRLAFFQTEAAAVVKQLVKSRNMWKEAAQADKTAEKLIETYEEKKAAIVAPAPKVSPKSKTAVISKGKSKKKSRSSKK